MQESAQIFLAIGAILAMGMAADLLGQRTALPRVSLLVLLGVAIGPAALNLIPKVLLDNFDMIAVIALVMIGFLLGGKLTRELLHNSGKAGLWMSLSAAIGTAIIVFIGLSLFGVPVDIALLLACIAAATAPAATFDTVMDFGKPGRFATLLLLVVALDDIWGLMLFSFALTVAGAMNGVEGNLSPLMTILQDLGGGVGIGLLLGLPAAFLTGRIKPGQPMLTEALVLTLLCVGLALWAEASFLIAAIVMGAVITNTARHHEYPFHAIENIERPFLIVFFVLAGAALELGPLWQTGLISLAYIGCRALGKVFGAAVGARLSGTSTATGRWMGIAMLPQAGVALGMALVAATAFPDYRDVLLPVVIGATVIFEIFGPLGTRIALAATSKIEADKLGSE
jgi:Kef-type K+ transport system membrane component KefB